MYEQRPRRDATSAAVPELRPGRMVRGRLCDAFRPDARARAARAIELAARWHLSIALTHGALDYNWY